MPDNKQLLTHFVNETLNNPKLFYCCKHVPTILVELKLSITVT